MKQQIDIDFAINASNGSFLSINLWVILSKNITESTTITPAAAPIITALSGVTDAQGLVMATRPARAPFKLMLISGLPNLIQEVTIARTAPAAAARFGVDKDHGDVFVGRGGGSGIETEPSQPENEDTQRGQRHVVAQNRFNLAVFAVFAQPRTQYDGTGQSGPSADGVNNGGTCKIDKTQTFKPALTVEQAAPGPAAKHRVNDRAQSGTVDQVTGEFRSFRHSSGNNRCGGGAKYDLEHPKGQYPGITADFKVGQKKAGGAEPSGGCCTEHNPEPDGPEGQRSHGKIHQVFHHDVDGVFGPGKPGFHHGKSGLHEKHQGGRHQGPDIIGMGLYQVD